MSISSLKRARPDWLRDKKVRILMQIALEKDPELQGVPFALDYVKNESDRKVMELNLTQKTIARPIIAPPGVPADRVAALRGAFAALTKDQEFLADAKKAKIEVSPLAGPTVDKVVAVITGTSPDVAARYATMMAPAKK